MCGRCEFVGSQTRNNTTTSTALAQSEGSNRTLKTPASSGTPATEHQGYATQSIETPTLVSSTATAHVAGASEGSQCVMSLYCINVDTHACIACTKWDMPT